MKKLGMNGLLAVAQGSHEEPKFIKLEYHGGGTKTITLVGKELRMIRRIITETSIRIGNYEV